MKTVTLAKTEERNFFEGSDGAFYTLTQTIEAECSWCGRWGHAVGLYHRQVLFKKWSSMICSRHVRPDEEYQTA